MKVSNSLIDTEGCLKKTSLFKGTTIIGLKEEVDRGLGVMRGNTDQSMNGMNNTIGKTGAGVLHRLSKFKLAICRLTWSGISLERHLRLSGRLYLRTNRKLRLQLGMHRRRRLRKRHSSTTEHNSMARKYRSRLLRTELIC